MIQDAVLTGRWQSRAQDCAFPVACERLELEQFPLHIWNRHQHPLCGGGGGGGGGWWCGGGGGGGGGGVGCRRVVIGEGHCPYSLSSLASHPLSLETL